MISNSHRVTRIGLALFMQRILILLFGTRAVLHTPTDAGPNIVIPVVAAV
jgi:multidrug efflux pump subunit AcrB